MPDKWFSPRDREARIAFERVQAEIGPLLGNVFPDFRLTHMGIHRRPADMKFIDGRDEIQIVLHLRPLGEAYAIQARLEAAAMLPLLPTHPSEKGGT